MSQFQRLSRLTRVSLAALCACGALSGFSADAAAKSITVVVDTAFTTLDPYDAGDTLSQNVAKSFYEGLFGFDKDMKVIPVLATGYEVSPDGLTYTVKLRDGVKFSDGTAFTAEAVKLNFERVTNPEKHLNRYQLYKNIASVEVKDPLTAVFHLKEPFSAFINQLAHPSGVMMCPSILGNEKADIAFHPCGTGPYVIEKYNPAEYLVVKKNPDYWQKGLPKLDGITWKPVPEASTRTAMMRTGEADYVDIIPPESVKILQKSKGVKVILAPSIVERQIYLNTTKKPFDDPRVRQALNYAVDKEALCKVVYQNFADPATGVAPVGVDYAKQFGVWPYDLKKAKELLTEAGYPNGFEATFWAASNASVYMKLLQFIQQQYAPLGIKLKIQALESGQRVTLMQTEGVKTTKLEMATWGWSSSTGEIDWLLRPLLHSESFPPSNFNFAFYSNPEIDKAIGDALRTTDRAEKTAIYDRAQEIIWKDAPWVFLVVDKIIAAQSEKLTGFYPLADGGYVFTEADIAD
ncbi:glutathione ABC transporter substrate-binding protein GsiB [Sutterella sp.]|uniref:glutathione ABC transporter substrate-binding protein GsiB n=1 Tax=Sutterella sp. TaxID=1981025 RepID=UPI0026E03E29|nr:glutathione ABC transporter substrate-binding protein GsiB [Sutterella sp.]MDO5532285.1 glutathione ABC transporter substrate-binding protein GsiB [Sutterella sp.]